MAPNTKEPRRDYGGPAFLSGGYRPMFLLGALWAAIAMALWLAVLTAGWTLPSSFDPVDWHVHELLFGFVPAVVCGFLLTAIPNWTGRLPVTGASLGLLVALWLLGRVAVLFGAGLPSVVVMLADLSFLIALVGFIAREITAGKNWRNMVVLAILTLILAGNGLFHLAVMAEEPASQGPGFRIGVLAVVLLIGLIGGRVIPSFTRNFLARQNATHLPVPFNQFDKLVMLASAIALTIWVAQPEARVTGVALLLAGALNAVRLSRWSGWQARSELLVLILHLGYAFVPLGYLMTGSAILWPDIFPQAAGIHSWTVGAVATMMLAVMTRASKGHSGRPLVAGGTEMLIYRAIILGALTRIWASFSGAPDWALHVSATGWIVAFGSFVLFYGPMLLTPKIAAKKPSSAGPA
ncbi:MAG: NnrS family protein [Marinosulfonomonas sp.]|nr:NnrS family protein [Marinosulfonomonas sp.]